MMLTEAEAKTRLCPLAASRAPYATVAEKGTDVDPDYVAEVVAAFPCIGSACMMWRTESLGEATTREAAEKPDHYPTGRNRLGHCGLAGKPA